MSTGMRDAAMSEVARPEQEPPPRPTREEPPVMSLTSALLDLRRHDLEDGPCWCSTEPSAMNEWRHVSACLSVREALGSCGLYFPADHTICDKPRGHDNGEHEAAVLASPATESEAQAGLGERIARTHYPACNEWCDGDWHWLRGSLDFPEADQIPTRPATPVAPEPRLDVEWLRHLLWSACPHDGKYGDDGEMQCRGTDFRREPIDSLMNHLSDALFERALDRSQSEARR